MSDPDLPPPTPLHAITAGATLDSLFQAWVARRGNALALLDPPDRSAFVHGTPRILIFAEADTMVTALARKLDELALGRGSVVGIQLPHTSEGVLTLLAVLRAGLVPALLPLLWRRVEIAEALRKVDAQAVMTCARVGTVDHLGIAARAAADVLSVRFVCAFGRGDDGIVPLDSVLACRPDPASAAEMEPPSSGDVAAITFDTSAGLRAVARTHAELLAGGHMVVSRSALAHGSCIVSAVALSSFAGLATTLCPWLLTGGTLALHYPFDAEGLATQRDRLGADALVLPAPAIAPLAEAGLLPGDSALRSIVALWRNPERCAAEPLLPMVEASVTDVLAFGEAGLVAQARGRNRIPERQRTGAHDAGGTAPFLELAQTPHDTLALRGPMVPDPAATGSHPCELAIDADGFVDTGWPVAGDGLRPLASLRPRPAEQAGVGGYVFRLADVQDLVGAVDPGASLVTRPHPLLGSTIATNPPLSAAACAQLATSELNPLIIAACRPHLETEPPFRA